MRTGETTAKYRLGATSPTRWRFFNALRDDLSFAGSPRWIRPEAFDCHGQDRYQSRLTIVASQDPV